MLVGETWVDRDAVIEVRDPYDETLVDTVPRGTVEDVELAVATAREGFAVWRRAPVHRRQEVLYGAAAKLKARAEEAATLIAREGSKTIREARKEVMRTIITLTVSGEEARRVVGETIPFDGSPGSENRRGYYFRFPVGVIAAITPFNDPLNLVAHKVGPALAGGNAVVVKPATLTPLSALLLAECLLAAGLPPGVLQVITGPGGEVGEALVRHSGVRMVSFTGGVAAGERVARMAGIKKLGLELGGNAPVLVMADADIEQAAKLTVSGAFWAAGQNCIGVQRVYVAEPVYERFRDRFVELTRAYRLGPKLDEATDMGPLISAAETERVTTWIAEAQAAGGTLLCGGERQGPTLAPTVFEGLPDGDRLACEEVFGPVVSLFAFGDFDEAIARANATPYGLHAAIFTRDLATALRATEELEVGGVMVNDSSDYRVDFMPFGGVGMSGLGREGVKFALQEMTEPRVVCFNL